MGQTFGSASKVKKVGSGTAGSGAKTTTSAVKKGTTKKTT